MFYFRFVYLLTEFCPGGELFDQLVKQDKFNNDQARFYSACVVEAFDYLHQRRIAHRDLKVKHFYCKTITFLHSNKMTSIVEKKYLTKLYYWRKLYFLKVKLLKKFNFKNFLKDNCLF